jgi:hypothetical protein
MIEASMMVNDLMPELCAERTSKILNKQRKTVIGSGNTIGQWAIIASGAVVTKNVPDYALMGRDSAKQMGWVCECGFALKENFKRNDCNGGSILVHGKLKKWSLEF